MRRGAHDEVRVSEVHPERLANGPRADHESAIEHDGSRAGLSVNRVGDFPEWGPAQVGLEGAHRPELQHRQDQGSRDYSRAPGGKEPCHAQQVDGRQRGKQVAGEENVLARQRVDHEAPWQRYDREHQQALRSPRGW